MSELPVHFLDAHTHDTLYEADSPLPCLSHQKPANLYYPSGQYALVLYQMLPATLISYQLLRPMV